MLAASERSSACGTGAMGERGRTQGVRTTFSPATPLPKWVYSESTATSQKTQRGIASSALSCTANARGSTRPSPEQPSAMENGMMVTKTRARRARSIAAKSMDRRGPFSPLQATIYVDDSMVGGRPAIAIRHSIDRVQSTSSTSTVPSGRKDQLQGRQLQKSLVPACAARLRRPLDDPAPPRT